MASAYPADAVGIASRKGRLLPSLDADFVLLTDRLAMVSTWIGGRRVFPA
jgi:N-acetylglucosamine-6-phosphate deacetylase